jgi:hypothetical protein
MIHSKPRTTAIAIDATTRIEAKTCEIGAIEGNADPHDTERLAEIVGDELVPVEIRLARDGGGALPVLAQVELHSSNPAQLFTVEPRAVLPQRRRNRDRLAVHDLVHGGFRVRDLENAVDDSGAVALHRVAERQLPALGEVRFTGSCRQAEHDVGCRLDLRRGIVCDNLSDVVANDVQQYRGKRQEDDRGDGENPRCA